MEPTDAVFGGRYRIVGEIGRGGMGVIYRGVDTILDREVAIKVMSADFGDSSEEARARFFREAKAAAKLQHRNIVTVFEFAEQDGLPYIVMEFLRGRSLSARMRSEPTLTLEQKLDIMTELCNGLQFAHENGVVHRDVKPANVWILEDGAVKLVDFGIAKIASSMMTLHRGDVMGSASYMSPEQIEGQSVTGRSDVFSAAVVLYELLARRRPFEGDSPTATMLQIVQSEPPPIQSLVPGLPRELVETLAKGLEKNPDKRFRSAAEFGTELQLIRMSLPPDQPVRTSTVPADDDTKTSLPLRSEPLPGQQAPSTPALPRERARTWIVAAAVATAVLAGAAWWNGRGPGEAVEPPQAVTPNPPAPAPAPVPQLIRVESQPPGAEITVNGAKVDTRTPGPVELTAGAIVRVESRGYQSAEKTVGEADVQRGSLRFELKPVEAAQVSVELAGSYAFEVWDGSTRLRDAADQHKFSVPEGRTLTLRSAEYFLNQEVTVGRGRRSMTHQVPELGTIALVGSEQCAVIIDGRRTDYYLMQQLPPMAAHYHQFSFTCTDGSTPRPQRVLIAPGDNPRRQVK